MWNNKSNFNKGKQLDHWEFHVDLFPLCALAASTPNIHVPRILLCANFMSSRKKNTNGNLRIIHQVQRTNKLCIFLKPKHINKPYPIPGLG